MYFVYIITNKNHTTLYVGVTNNLNRRIKEHKEKLNNGFSAKYNLNILIYFEVFDTPSHAIFREKQIKKYSRMKKENLINHRNPNWDELIY